jgi:hypothetical protein
MWITLEKWSEAERASNQFAIAVGTDLTFLSPFLLLSRLPEAELKPL